MAPNVFNDITPIYNGGQWQVNTNSPMHNLLRNEVKLKQYSKKIRHSIVRSIEEISFNEFIVVTADLPYLKYSDEEPDSLMITVSSIQDRSKTKVGYVAIFLSWGVSVSSDDTTHLPYMLERGEPRIGTAVKASVQRMFKCNIKPYSFTQHQLLQFAFSFVEDDISKDTDPLTLSYETPQADFKNKLSFTFEYGDVHTIWHGIKEDSDSESECITMAYRFLRNQIRRKAQLDVSMFDVCEVKLPKAAVKSTGIVKMKTPQFVYSVFTVLNEITFNDELSDESD